MMTRTRRTGPYDQTAVDSWLTIHADNTASLKIGKVEMGQGTPTGVADDRG